MKKLKKLLSIVLAVAMVLSLVVVTSADESTEYTITINNSTEGYTYAAYQIFAGDLASDGETLTNIAWGNEASGANLLTALAADRTEVTGTDGSSTTMGKIFAGCTSAGDVADVLADYGNDSDVVVRFAEIAGDKFTNASATTSEVSSDVYKLTGLSAGYYLVKNTAVPTDTDDSETSTYTSYILRVVANTSVTPKTSVPEMTKKVKETNDSTGETSNWQDTADYDIGDNVPFRLTGTVASNIADYGTYSYTFHDAMSAGLEYVEDSVTVTIYSGYTKDAETDVVTPSGTSVKVSSGYYTVETFTSGSSSGCDFEVQFKDLLSCKDESENAITITEDSLVVVEFKAKLTGEAVKVGNNGNPNTAYLEYSNNPYDLSETGSTPWDTVVVYTYEVDLNKIDASDKIALEGAEFTLYKVVKSDVNLTSFKPSTTQYYTFDSVSGSYVAVDSDAAFSDGTEYYTLTELGTESGKTPSGGDKANFFEFKGLDAGIYILRETTTPSGYNTMSDITFTISATISSTYNAATVSGEGIDSYSGAYVTNLSATELTDEAADGAKGTLTADIGNSKGSSLPSTGGIGTTVFYVVGGVLILVAVVLLITKKRISKEDK